MASVRTPVAIGVFWAHPARSFHCAGCALEVEVGNRPGPSSFFVTAVLFLDEIQLS